MQKKYTSLKITRSFDEAFDALLKSIHRILRYSAEDYSAKYLGNVSFINDFDAYYDKAQQLKDTFSTTHASLIQQLATPQKLDVAIAQVVDVIKASMLPNPVGKLEQEVAFILNNKEVDLWPDLTATDRQRLLVVHRETFWHKVTRRLREHIKELRQAITRVTEAFF